MICEVALEKQVGFRISQLKRQNHDIPGLSDSGNSSLNGLSPSDNIWDIVWLIHSKYIELEVNWGRIRNETGLHSEDNFAVGSVLGRDLSPQCGELIISRTSLSDDLEPKESKSETLLDQLNYPRRFYVLLYPNEHN